MSPFQQNNGRHVVWFYADIKMWNDPRELGEDDIQLLRKFGE